MKTFEYGGRTFEVEDRKMNASELNIAFLDETDFGAIYGWVTGADLSRIELADEEGEVAVYEGYTDFKALTFLQATEYDFWEGLRAVVALAKPGEE